MKLAKFASLVLFTAGLSLSAIGHAATTATTNASTLQPRTYNGITYVTGGVGEEERNAMRQMGAQFNLWLWFATKGGGQNLADIHVTVQDRQAKQLLDVVSDGPWLFARLPAGTYKVSVATKAVRRSGQSRSAPPDMYSRCSIFRIEVAA